MATKQHRRAKRRQNPVLPLAVGLLFVGFAVVFLAFSGNRTRADTGDQSVGFSRAPLAVDFPAPELALESLDGQTRSLAEYRSNVVLVNNWATWCPPCKAEMPVLQAYYQDHAEQGFMIVAVEAGDPGASVSAFAQDYGLTFQVWLDPQGAALRAFGNGSLPNTYIIDRAGTVRYAWTGEIDRDTLEKYVTPLFAE